MHVDGGAMTQVFAYPPNLSVADTGIVRPRSLYIIRNARLDADWASVRRRTLPIATRAVSGLMQSQGMGDLFRIFLTTRRDGVDYNLAFIPPTFTTPHEKDFDPVFMRALYDVGYQMAAGGFPWRKEPPGYVEPLRPATERTDGPTATSPPAPPPLERPSKPYACAA